MDQSTRLSAIKAYLVGLYGEHPHGLLWIGGHADGWRGRTFSDVDDAARYAVELDDRGGIGVYHRGTTLARRPERRGDAADSRMVHYFALDVDIAGPGHKTDKALPASMSDAVALIGAAGFPEPTTWVHSGGGFYPQWRFAEPIDVADDPEVMAWVTDAFDMISAHFIDTAGREYGWHLDNVRDLARVFRLPGTTNRKVPDAPVICYAGDGAGGTFDLGVLASLARPNRGVVHEAPKSAPAEHPTPTGDDLFDDAARTFTREQAVTFVKEAMTKLGQTEAGFNAAINNFAMVCAHFPWLISRERCGQLMIKALGEKTGWTEPDRDDRITIDSAYKATEQGKSWVATEVDSPVPDVDAGGQGEITGGVLPPPNRPYEVARELVSRMPMTSGRPHWAWWRGDFYHWTGAHWSVAEQSVMEHWLYKQTGDATFLVPVKGKKEGDKVEFEHAPWAPTKKRIMDLVHALGIGTVQRFGEEDRALAAANGVIVNRKLQDHDPDRFNLWSLPFSYDEAASAPSWEAFLEQVLPGDQEAKDFLGEWFGYVLSGRTDHQKMAALIGEKRSGKGTIARVLSALLGTGNVSGLNLNLLSGTFGMEPLIGKALAVAGDVRWASRNIADAVPILLGVIGEDDVTIPRKNRSAWHGRLGSRFMLMSNETPTFNDKSGALGGRMVFVRFDQSFYGREDTSLTEKLIEELPGILNWALDGLARLNGRGRFTEPKSGEGERDAQRRLADPVGAFLDDWCVIGDGESIALDHLYLKYQNWCIDGGRTRDSTTKEIFARDLNKKVPGLRTERTRVSGKRVRTLFGVGSDAV